MTTTTKKTAAADETPAAADAATERPERARRTPPFVGPPLGTGQEPAAVTLSHHLRVDGESFAPGDKVTVSPDYARQLRRNGFTART